MVSRLIPIFLLLTSTLSFSNAAFPRIFGSFRKTLISNSLKVESPALSVPLKTEQNYKLAGWKEQCQGGNSMLNITCQPGLVCVQIFPYRRISKQNSFVGVCAKEIDSITGVPLATCNFNERFRGGGCSTGYRCLPQANLYESNQAISRTNTLGYCWPSNATRGGKCRYGGRVEPIVCPKKLVCAIGKLPEFPDSPFEGKCVKQGKSSHSSALSKQSTSSPVPPSPSPSPPPPPMSNSSNTPDSSASPSADYTFSPNFDDSPSNSLEYELDSLSPQPSSEPNVTSVDMSDGLYIPLVGLGSNCLTAGKYYACEDGLVCEMKPDQPEVGPRWGICAKKP